MQDGDQSRCFRRRNRVSPTSQQRTLYVPKDTPAGYSRAGPVSAAEGADTSSRTGLRGPSRRQLSMIADITRPGRPSPASIRMRRGSAPPDSCYARSRRYCLRPLELRRRQARSNSASRLVEVLNLSPSNAIDNAAGARERVVAPARLRTSKTSARSWQSGYPASRTSLSSVLTCPSAGTAVGDEMVNC